VGEQRREGKDATKKEKKEWEGRRMRVLS